MPVRDNSAAGRQRDSISPPGATWVAANRLTPPQPSPPTLLPLPLSAPPALATSSSFPFHFPSRIPFHGTGAHAPASTFSTPLAVGTPARTAFPGAAAVVGVGDQPSRRPVVVALPTLSSAAVVSGAASTPVVVAWVRAPLPRPHAGFVRLVDFDVCSGRSRCQNCPQVLHLSPPPIHPPLVHASCAALLLLHPSYTPVRGQEGPVCPVQLPRSEVLHLSQRSGRTCHYRRRQIEPCCPFLRQLLSGFVPPQGLHAPCQRLPNIRNSLRRAGTLRSRCRDRCCLCRSGLRHQPICLPPSLVPVDHDGRFTFPVVRGSIG